MPVLPRGGFPTPSLNFTRLGNAATKNLSTEGTIDWFAVVTSSNQLRDATNLYWKVNGGLMFATYDFWTRGQGSGQAAFSSQMSSTSIDTIHGSVLSNSTLGSHVSTISNTTTNYGWRFSVPSAADGVIRRLRINCYNTNIIAQLTAKLDMGLTYTENFDSGAETKTEHEFQIDFTGGGLLTVSFQCTQHLGPSNSTRQLAFQCATLALAA